MVTLYGIPNCDTVRKARKWLEQHDVDYQFHDFRADGLTTSQVKSWIEDLGLETLINKRSTSWQQLSPTERDSLNASTAVALLQQHPTLIKRPLLDTGSQRCVGFKPDSYQTLLG